MSSTPQDRQKAVIAIPLSFAAGCVDIVGYLSAYHAFTAHMTGNTVHLGNAIFDRDFTGASLAAILILAFVAGSLAGRALIEIGARSHIRTIASWTLGIEAALLAFVASGLLGAQIPDLVPRHATFDLTLLAFAMGLQTATITRVGALTVHTTFVTGMINKFCQLVSQALFETYDVCHANSSAMRNEHMTELKRRVRGASFILSIWCSYALGAVAGTWVQTMWRLRALYVPVIILCLAITADQMVPLAIEEERDQGER